MFTLKIGTDNAAFEHLEYEVARILRGIANKIENGCDESGAIMDANGNTVGTYTLTEGD